MIFDLNFGGIGDFMESTPDWTFSDVTPTNTFQEVVSITGSNSSNNQSIGASVNN